MSEVIHISYKRFNPNFHHLKEALRDDDLRFIFLKGGSSSAKSFSIAQCFLLCCLTDGYNTKVYRKTGASIADSIYKTFQEAARSINVYGLFEFKENKIVCFNGSYVTFSGLDDPEKIKGLESYQYVFCEELNEFDYSDFKQIKKRLRGRRGQKIVSAFNPVSVECWIKKDVFDNEKFNELPNDLYGKLRDSSTGRVLPKGFSQVFKKCINAERVMCNPRTGAEEAHLPDTLVLWSTYLNNFWVVGSPCGTYGFYDRQTVAEFEKDRATDYNQYMVYALGEWGSIKTGGEFLHAFNLGKHKRRCVYTKGLPVHISIDNNVLPYISISIWQCDSLRLSQVHEICAEDPFNTVTKAAEMTRLWLDSVGYEDVVYLYGDASTRSGNTIDEEKRSFLDKFIEGVEVSFRVEDRIPPSNPPVAISGEFVNAILGSCFSGLFIEIDESCKKSMHDYENVKKDVNGGILKKRITNKLTKQTYEEFGHLTDALRYVCVCVFKSQFTKFSLRRKRSAYKEDDMKYYNASVEGSFTDRVAYVMPCYNEMFIMSIVDVGEFANIVDVSFNRSYSEEAVIDKINAFGPTYTVVECGKSFFPMVRNLRDRFDDIKALDECPNVDQRISAYSSIVKDRIRFRSDYEEIPEYCEFVNSIMDYNGSGKKEAVNFISGVCAHVVKRFFS